MRVPFHAGERAVQAREGVAEDARRVGESIHDELPPAAREFATRQRFVIVAAGDGPTGPVWASAVAGPPGFARAVDARTLEIDAPFAPGDPLERALRAGDPVGVLAIELATRRRMKVKGVVESRSESGFRVRVRAAVSLCPRYIQKREIGPAGDARRKAPAAAAASAALDDRQRTWIAGADTSFLATRSAEGGADAAHRGGRPGFVRVVDARTLEIPDYAGNNMFQSLGNLETSPAAALLFVDFASGGTLQLSGSARASWDPERVARHAGAKRVLEIRIERVVENPGALPIRGTLVEPSPFNPA